MRVAVGAPLAALRRRNDDLVEEITAQVWASFGVHNGKRLRGYDPERSRFATFLGGWVPSTVSDHISAKAVPDAGGPPIHNTAICEYCSV